jgi:hypothetical protein
MAQRGLSRWVVRVSCGSTTAGGQRAMHAAGEGDADWAAVVAAAIGHAGRGWACSEAACSWTK